MGVQVVVVRELDVRGVRLATGLARVIAFDLYFVGTGPPTPVVSSPANANRPAAQAIFMWTSP